MLVLDWKERAFIETVNSKCFCYYQAAILVDQKGAPIWRLHTKLCGGAWNILANNSETMGRKDLRLGQIVQNFVFDNMALLPNLMGKTVKTSIFRTNNSPDTLPLLLFKSSVHKTPERHLKLIKTHSLCLALPPPRWNSPYSEYYYTRCETSLPYLIRLKVNAVFCFMINQKELQIVD